MRPIIGIPLRAEIDKDTDLSRIAIYENLRRSIQRLGADIMPIAPVLDVDCRKTKYKEYPAITSQQLETLKRFLDLCDGIILPGGDRYMPTNQYIIEYAIKKNIPILGICLGMQEMSCYKEEFWIEKNEEENLNHYQSQEEMFHHTVQIKKDSLLYKILGREQIKVNSFHNYHVTANPYYKAVAVSEDGLIEAIEYSSNTFNIGVQWHPEKNIEKDPYSKKLLQSFLEEASISRDNQIYEKSI